MWDYVELLILARVELVFSQSGMRNINQQLIGITPGRTLESIKGTCKGTRYQTLLALLQREADSSEPQKRITFDPDPVALDNVPKQHQPGPLDTTGVWAAEVPDIIKHLGIPAGININSIDPDHPTQETREMIDGEHARWLPPLVRPERRQPRQRTGLTIFHNPRVRRRAAYTRTQRSFIISGKHCAQDALSGAWKGEPSPVPMAEQEPYWCGILQVPSKNDEQQPQPKGLVQWSLVSPIRVGDVTKPIKGMSDKAPRPDGRTLNDLKAFRRVAACRLPARRPQPRGDGPITNPHLGNYS